MIFWIDFSKRDRRQMLDVVQLFRDTNTLDELGIASVRDAFSEMLFPGTSTIQTRARYFLIVPWLLQWREKQPTPSAKLEAAVRHDELGLIERILSAYQEAGRDPLGVIGRDARWNLQRRASEIYWGGLGRWGIRRVPLSRWEYFRYLDTYRDRSKRARQMEEAELLADPWGSIWDPHMPPPPRRFPWQPLTLDLTSEEASYLHERILASCAGTLLAHLVDEGTAGYVETRYPWDHPDAPSAPPPALGQLTRAKEFAYLMNGALLLYNLMLAEMRDDEERLERFRDRMARWSDLMKTEDIAATWNRSRFWKTLRPHSRSIALSTRLFVDAWLDLCRGADTSRIAASPAARRLIEARESHQKGPRARLRSPRYLELWGGDSGSGVLDYRWGVVSKIVADIVVGRGTSVEANGAAAVTESNAAGSHA